MGRAVSGQGGRRRRRLLRCALSRPTPVRSLGAALAVKRLALLLINLDPTTGAEMKKTRPSIVISPDEMNRDIATVIIAPMTTKGTPYPTRVACKFQGEQGQVVLDQIR